MPSDKRQDLPLPPPAGDFFGTKHLDRNLRTRSLRGGAVTLVAQGAKLVLFVGVNATLARMLTPKDFGLIGMVTAITGFVMQFKDLGLAMSTVQIAETSHRQVSTLFWINVAFGAAVMLLTAACSPLIAWFYGEPRLIRITLALAVSFLFAGLTVQHQALLRRQMRFATLAAVEVTAVLVGAGIAIVSTFFGVKYWALVVMYLGIAATTMVGVWLSCRWRPGPPVRGSGVRSMLAFGGNLTAVNLLGYVARNMDKVFIGKVWGAGVLGLYGKAYEMLLLPIQQINTPVTSVAIPTLSRLQHKPEAYRSSYLNAIRLLVIVGMPIVVFMFVAADKIVLAVFGDQWNDAVPIFRTLAPAAVVGTFNVATGWVFVSLGQTDRQLRWSVVATVVTVAAYLVGLRWGAIGVAAAFSITQCGLRLPGIVYCYRRSPLRSADLGETLWRPALAAVMAGGILYVADRWIAHHFGLLVSLLLDGASFGLSYTLAWFVLPGGRRILKETLNLVLELRQSGTLTGKKASGSDQS